MERHASRRRRNWTAIAAALWLCGTFAASATTWAATIQNFDTDGGGTDYAAADCVPRASGPLPKVFSGGPPGSTNFLRLAEDIVETSNTIAFKRTDKIAAKQIVAEWDFRMIPRFRRADGMGFAVLRKSEYGKKGGVCTELPPFVPEEPNFAQSIGVGFDIHKAPSDPNNNHISVHFNAAVVASCTTTSPLDLASGKWIHAKVTLRPGGGFSDVTVELTPLGGDEITVIDACRVPNFQPYEGRVLFGARSGGESAEHDIDNIDVRFFKNSDPDPDPEPDPPVVDLSGTRLLLLGD